MIILFLIVIGLLIFTFKDRLNLSNFKLPNNIMPQQPQQTAPQSGQILVTENEWCKTQQLIVSEDRELPVKDEILGWDAKNSCCLRSVSGWDCALKRNVNLQYCYTSNIGGVINYATVDNYYLGNADNYIKVLNNIDKYEIYNKLCDAYSYPEQVK